MKEQLPYYNAEDLARYHRGEMTAAEMHSLEMAALNDPFLADALEGYALDEDAVTSVRNIENRLRKPQPVVRNLYMRWAIAASLIFVIGLAGYFVNQRLSRTDDTVLARQEQLKPAAPAQTSGSSNSEVQSEAPAVDSLPVIAPPVIADRSSKQEINLPQPAPQDAPAANSVPPVGLQPPPQQDAVVNAEPANASDYAINKEVAAPPVQAPKPSIAQNRNIEKMKRSFNQEEEALMDSLVTDKNNTVFKPQIFISVQGRNTLRSGEIMLRKQLEENYSGLTQDGKYTGTVTVTFDTDVSGEMVNVKVTRSLCSSCDKSLIEILQRNIDWNIPNQKDNRMLISIR